MDGATVGSAIAIVPSSVPVAAPARRSADDVMRRALRIVDVAPSPHRPGVRRAFSASVLLSAVRCLLTYVILPFVAPALGIAAQVGPGIGIPLVGLAVAANVVTIRRFWQVNHPWRWAYTTIALTVIVLLVVLVAGDVAELVV